MPATIDLALLDAWRIGPVLATSVPDSGAINRTLLADAASGSYVLRAYRHRDRAQAARKHALIARCDLENTPSLLTVSRYCPC